MPTRIVLDVSDERPIPAPGRKRRKIGRKNRPPLNSSRASSRKIVTFRKSIFTREDSKVLGGTQESQIGLSTTDIRASPRLIGYVYQLLASFVMLITVIKFYRTSPEEEGSNFSIYDVETDRRVYTTASGTIYFWKLLGCAIIGSLGVVINLIVVLAHFDTFCCPRLWFVLFRDDSKWEQNLMRFMVIFWACGLHVCTSSFSVGTEVANIYFTAWIAFVASCMNYGVWRVSAGLSSTAEKITLHHRETTYNWYWTFGFVVILAGAVTDMWFNRKYVTITYRGDEVTLTRKDWILVLSLLWGFVFISMVALLMNHFSTKALGFRLCFNKTMVIGWRQLEGIIILGMLGAFFWMIYEHTGVDGVVNGLNNAYFGVWGSFFNSVLLLGTWLKENKNIEYFVDKPAENDEESNHRLPSPVNVVTLNDI